MLYLILSFNFCTLSTFLWNFDKMLVKNLMMLYLTKKKKNENTSV